MKYPMTLFLLLLPVAGCSNATGFSGPVLGAETDDDGQTAENGPADLHGEEELSPVEQLSSLILKVSGYTQIYPALKRKVFEKRYKFKGMTEATLVYSFTMKDGFEFVKGGKLPGLAGGSGTTGCDNVDPSGWSMRYMWQRNGRAVVYAYHQDRENRCGDAWNIGDFVIGKKHVLQQYVRINSPRIKNGILKVWLDGKLVLDRNDVRFRGNVRSSSALADTFLLSTFYGGSDDSWAPSRETAIEFGDFRVYSGSPKP